MFFACSWRIFAEVFFTSTLHSGIFKLATITAPPANLTLYRGTGNMALGPDFFQRDAQGFAGGVELGFMSATANKQVALWFAGMEALGLKWREVGSQKPSKGQEVKNQALAGKLEQQQLEFTKEEWDQFKLPTLSYDSYIKAGNRYFKPAAEEGKEATKHLPTLYVIEVGKMSIGANIADISQFEGEEEFVYPMLTRLELSKEPELSPDGKVSTIYLKLTVNQRSTTVEDAEQARRRFLTRLAHSLQWSLRNWARQHAGLAQRLRPQTVGVLRCLLDEVCDVDLALLNTNEGYGKVFVRILHLWENSLMQLVVEPLWQDGEQEAATGRTDESILRFEQAIDAAVQLCANGKEVRDRIVQMRRLLVEVTDEGEGLEGKWKKALAKDLLARSLVEEQNEFQQAIPLFKEAIELCSEVCAVDSSPHRLGQVACNHANLATVFERMGRYEDALAQIQKSLELFESLDQPQNVASSHDLIGNLRLHQNHLKGALDAYHKGLEIRIRVWGPRHPDVAKSRDHIGTVLRRMGRPQEALVQHQQALQMFIEYHGPDHPSVATSYALLAQVLTETQDVEGAIDATHKQLKIESRAFGTDHPRCAETMHQLGLCYLKQGRHDKALFQLQRSLEIKMKPGCQNRGQTPLDIAKTEEYIAVIYQEQGHLSKALEMFKSVVETKKKAYNDDDMAYDMAATYNNMAVVYQKLGNEQRAREMGTKAHNIFLKTLGPDHPFTKQTSR